MNRRSIIFVGLFILALVTLSLVGSKMQTEFSARLFPFSQSNSSEQVFLPSDFVAMPGESGEVVLRAGEGFPVYARNEVMGLSFDIGWDSAKVEFLGATTYDTIFDGGDFELSIDHTPGQEYANITVWTASNNGVRVSPGTNLAMVMMKVKNNAEIGDELVLPLTSAEIAYNEDNLQSVNLNSLQSGVIRIGNPNDPDGVTPYGNDFSFETRMLAKPGEERLVALRSVRHTDLSGFVFDLQFPEPSMRFLGYETKGTVLERQGFQIIANDETDNHLLILGATGKMGGVGMMPNEPLLFLRFLVEEDVPIGTELSLMVENMEIVDGLAEEKQEVSVGDGQIIVNNVSTLRLEDAIPLSSTSIRLVFTDNIVEADLDDISFSPRIINNRTVLEKSGKTLILRNLTSMVPDKLYEVNVQESVMGNIAGTLSAKHNFAFFSGYPAQYPMARFRIEKVEASSDTSILVTFTDEISPATIERNDYRIEGLTVFDVKATDNPKQIQIVTGSHSGVNGSTWLKINAESQVHDLLSASGELLSLNIASFTPARLTGQGPQLESVEAEKTDDVHINFDKPILGASIVPTAFVITEEGRTTNLVNPQTIFDISLDHKTITLHGIRTVAGRTYRLRVVPGVLRENGSNQVPVNTVGNLAAFAGQGSFYTPWDFVLEDAESISPSKVRLVFSEEVSDQQFSPLDFEIWTKDSNEQPRKLKIVSVTKEAGMLILETEVQHEDASYFVLTEKSDLKSAFGEMIGIPSGRGFFGFSSGQMRAVSVQPAQVDVGTEAELTVTGVHFPEGSVVRLKLKTLETKYQSETKLTATATEDLPIDNYDLIVVSPDGRESRIPNAVLVVDPEREDRLKPQVLSEESYASPFRVPNDGNMPTTLWVRIQDPRGVSDIEKVVADLRIINGSAAVDLSLHEFVDDKAWYKLEVTVPSTVPTGLEPIEIPITVENKTGRKGFGTVSLMITRDLDSSIPPVIESSGVSPDQLAPGSESEVTFFAEVSDQDGGGNVARVVLDASKLGLGIIVLNPIPEIEEDRDCARSDYIVGTWSDCINDVQTRSVELKPDIECSVIAGIEPEDQRACTGGRCTRSDWEAGAWGFCVDGKQTREYQKVEGTTCVGQDDKPAPETRDCQNGQTTGMIDSILDLLVPSAHARTVFGNLIWYQSEPQVIPKTTPEGVYELPLTIIDREGTEAHGKIAFRVTRDATGSPNIDDDEIFVSPRSSVPNDNTTEFQIYARVTDPNGHDDIESVVANLAPIGLPPTAMVKGQIEGAGAWYSTDPLTIPRSVIPGFRQISIAATDKDGNSTEEEVRFYVATPDTYGDEPTIPADRAYTNPRAFLNDQETTGTLYVFVQEGDAPISQVTVNMGTILKFSGSSNESSVTAPNPASGGGGDNVDGEAEEDPPDLPPAPRPAVSLPNHLANLILTPVSAAEGDPVQVSGCVSTESVACLNPAASEGSRGRWFYISGLVVRENVAASQNPYFVSVTATDTDGRRAAAEIPIYVTDGVLPETGYDLPHLVTVVATDRNLVEAYFSSSLDPTRIRRDAFKFVLYDDLGTELPIREMDIRSDGRVITFTTNYMNPGDRYTLIADSEQLGLRHVQPTDNQVDFIVPSDQDDAKPFEVESAVATSANSVEIIFSKDIRFSSLKTNGANFTITKKGSEQELAVKGAQISKNARTVVLSTATQTSGTTYILRVDDLLDYTGKQLRRGTNIKVFPAFRNFEPNPFVITKKRDKEIIQMGETVTFTVTVANHSPNETYSDVEIFDDFPADTLELLDVETSGQFSCQNDGAEIRCTLENIPPDTTYSFTAKFKAVGSGFATNTVSATNAAGKTVASSANVSIIDAGNPFLIKKMPEKAETVIEKKIDYTIQITNRTKGQHLTNVTVIDDFPEELLRLDHVEAIGGWSCQYDETEIRCMIPSFAPGATYRMNVQFTPVQTGMAINTVTASGAVQGGAGEDAQVTGATSAILEIWEPNTNADFNRDGKVDFLDFSIFATVYQSNGKDLPQADFDNSGFVDFVDFTIFAQQYGMEVSRDTGAPQGGELPEQTANDDDDDTADDNTEQDTSEGPPDDGPSILIPLE